MRPIWKKAAAVAFLSFLALWIAGVARVWSLPAPPPPALHLSSAEGSPNRQQMANNLAQLGLARSPLPLVLEQGELERIQVYDQSAHLACGTASFDEDAAKIRAALSASQAVVFNEKDGGLAPERRFALEIGVAPERFEALVEQLRGVGRLESFSVQRQDRTGEFRRLHAQRQSLKKHLEAVQKLRAGKAQSVDDELKLEQRIQDIEKELQALGAQLGDFLGKESQYHVHLVLFEYQPGGSLDRTFSVPQRLGHAFLWALTWWGTGALALGLLGGALLSVRALRGR